MDGAALCARFSLATNRLEFCGPSDAAPVLYRAVTDGIDLAAARGFLSRFEALYPYLEAIGAKHGLDPFDERVVEAYWIGNELLERFDAPDFRDLLERLRRRGLPRSTAERLAARLPDRPIPHHTFHVTFVGVGEVTGHVETTLPNMERCRPALARVLHVGPETLEAGIAPLVHESGRLALGPEAPVELRYDPRIVPGVRPGDRVVVHWGLPALILDSRRASALAQWTGRSLDATNAASPETRAPGDPSPGGTRITARD